MRRSLLLATILLLTTHIISMARLGENEKEVEKRYGRRVILPGNPPVCSFETGPYRIHLIMEDDAVACIIYSKKDGVGFSYEEIELLMEKNCPGSWRLNPRIDREEPRTWVSTNGDFAVHSYDQPVALRVPATENLLLVSGRALDKARQTHALWRYDKRSPLIRALLQSNLIPRDLIAPEEDKNATKESLDQLGL